MNYPLFTIRHCRTEWFVEWWQMLYILVSLTKITNIEISIKTHELSIPFQFENLGSPYDTHCKTKPLKSFSKYTTEGCISECLAEHAVKHCACRRLGYNGTS